MGNQHTNDIYKQYFRGGPSQEEGSFPPLNLLNLATQEVPMDEDNMSMIDLNALTDSPPGKMSDSMSYDLRTPDEKNGDESCSSTI